MHLARGVSERLQDGWGFVLWLLWRGFSISISLSPSSALPMSVNLYVPLFACISILRLSSRISLSLLLYFSKCLSDLVAQSARCNSDSEGRGCLEEGCLGLPGVLPDIY